MYFVSLSVKWTLFNALITCFFRLNINSSRFKSSNELVLIEYGFNVRLIFLLVSSCITKIGFVYPFSLNISTSSSLIILALINRTCLFSLSSVTI